MKQLIQIGVAAALMLACGAVQAQTAAPTTNPSDWVQQIRAQIAAAEAKVTAPAACESAGKALALLCQSDPFFFKDEPSLVPAWTPPEVMKLGPTWVHIAPAGARVEFGGGFHHFGYDLKRNNAADNSTDSGWTLEFYSEDVANRVLKSFSLKKTDHVELQQFVNTALAEFERRAGLKGNSDRSVNERLVFLLKFNEVEAARKSIRDCAAASSDDWADQLLAYIMDAKTSPAAAGRLEAWVQKQGDGAAWLLAAYAYGIAGDNDAADRSARIALSSPVDDPAWLIYNARFRGTPVCLQLLKRRHYATCAALCNSLLEYDGGTVLAAQLTAIHDLAGQWAPNDPPPTPPPIDDDMMFEPFKGIDLSRLTVTAAAQAPASTRSSASLTDPTQARMIEYFDHRIAADPKSRRNFTEKITYLLSIKREADALSACRAAALAFPSWWRPRMALALRADAGSRKEAEAALLKWAQDNPGFIHWWYLCRYYRQRSQDSDAIAALQSAVKYPLEHIDEDETWVPAAFAFDAASYAYQQKQYALVLEIARVWSSPRGVYNYFNNDIYAFRAAAELALGQFPAAKADADNVVAEAAKRPIWAQHLAELQKAANEQNRGFKYDPGTLSAGWTLFPER